ncbi:MAG: small ribosomal subunit Rsm22 family protein, partial [Verrucomicrobiae bacterium]|nr:small ribosomal subunit Rsm22 family protein [Verrucomicrobiae bacterium]
MTNRNESYPSVLEEWWRRQALRETGRSDGEAALDTLRAVVDSLSQNFTAEREAGFDEYAHDYGRLAAYGLFYFPQGFMRPRFVLRELAQRCGWTPPSQGARILDIGCGTGAAGLGIAREISRLSPGVTIHGIDTAGQSLRVFSQLFADNAVLWPGVQMRTHKWTGQKLNEVEGIRDLRFDLVVASFSLNEMFFGRPQETVNEWVESVLRETLSEKGVFLILEPSLRESSERLERLRDHLCAQQTARVLAPCLHASACPLLKEGKYWCHEVRSWEPPESFVYINRKLQRSSGQSLKFSFLALAQPEGSPVLDSSTPDNPLPEAATFRLISPVAKAKGKMIMAGCNAAGQKAEYEILQ